MGAESLTEFELWSKGGWPTVDVVGEFYHQRQIRALFPATLSSDSREFRGVARLIPEPGNPHDRNAVGIHVDGQHIEDLSASVAKRYSGVLSGLVGQGMLPTTTCRIWGYERQEWQGQDRRGHDVYETVFEAQATIALDEPHLCVPVNLPPSQHHRLLPYGSALQLKGEELHLDVLTPLVAAHGDAWAYGTLRALTVATGRTDKSVVEVHLDDHVIGELTPAMSAHFAPVIAHLALQGQLAAARVLLKGNVLKVEAVLYAAKSHELGAEWIGDRTPEPSSPAPPPPSVAPDRSLAVAPSPSPAPAPGPGPTNTTWLETFSVPEKPLQIVFRVPPGWPPPPDGWEPSPGWAPRAEWPPPPPGWQFWVAR